MTLFCNQCRHYQRTPVFELCAHPKSEYRIADGKPDQHMAAHMRGRGACGPEGKLWEAKE